MASTCIFSDCAFSIGKIFSRWRRLSSVIARMASSSVMLRTIQGIFTNPASSLACCGGGFFLALYRGGLSVLALGHFVSRLGRGLVRGRLISLVRAATACPRPSRFAGPRFFFLGLAAPPALGLMAEYFMSATSCFFCCSIDRVPPFFDAKRSIKKIPRECTAGYVGREKKRFGVFFICMNCRPKRERHCCVRCTGGLRRICPERRRSRQKRRYIRIRRNGVRSSISGFLSRITSGESPSSKVSIRETWSSRGIWE